MIAPGEEYTEVWAILRFPVVPREVLADMLAPLIRDAISTGGELNSLSIRQETKPEEEIE